MAAGKQTHQLSQFEPSEEDNAATEAEEFNKEKKTNETTDFPNSLGRDLAAGRGIDLMGHRWFDCCVKHRKRTRDLCVCLTLWQTWATDMGQTWTISIRPPISLTEKKAT